jgi:hypothetical protein
MPSPISEIWERHHPRPTGDRHRRAAIYQEEAQTVANRLPSSRFRDRMQKPIVVDGICDVSSVGQFLSEAKHKSVCLITTRNIAEALCHIPNTYYPIVIDQGDMPERFELAAATARMLSLYGISASLVNIAKNNPQFMTDFFVTEERKRLKKVSPKNSGLSGPQSQQKALAL